MVYDQIKRNQNHDEVLDLIVNLGGFNTLHAPRSSPVPHSRTSLLLLLLLALSSLALLFACSALSTCFWLPRWAVPI